LLICPSGHFSQKSDTGAGFTVSGAGCGPQTAKKSWRAAAPKAGSASVSSEFYQRAMLPAPNRLKKTVLIERVWKRGRSFFAPGLQLRIVANNLAVSRFAVVIGLKAEKSAVKRNTWRRRIREILRVNLLKIAPGFDCVIYAKKEGVGFDSARLENSLAEAFAKAGLLVRHE